MIESPLPAYVDAYWGDVADLLKSVHGASEFGIDTVIANYRKHMKSAGQTIYNDSPEETADTIIGHGLIPSLPAIGAKLQLTFALTDPKTTAANPDKLVAALDRLERDFGGEGFKTAVPEPLPGLVLLTLNPVNALGAVERLQKVAAELDKASRQLARADKELKVETARREKAGVRVSAAVAYQPECDSEECSR